MSGYVERSGLQVAAVLAAETVGLTEMEVILLEEVEA